MSPILGAIVTSLAMVALVIGGGGVVGKLTSWHTDRKNDRQAQRDLALTLAWCAVTKRLTDSEGVRMKIPLTDEMIEAQAATWHRDDDKDALAHMYWINGARYARDFHAPLTPQDYAILAVIVRNLAGAQVPQVDGQRERYMALAEKLERIAV